MGWGDEVVAAGQAQRVYDADPSLRVAICDQQAQPRWHPIWDGNPILATPDEVRAGEPVRAIVSGPNCRPYIVYPFTKESGWTFNRSFRCRDHLAKIYLTDEEREIGERARETYGPYVLIEPFTKHENFRWSMRRWQEVVDAFPKVTFIQHMHADSQLLKWVSPERATFRQACALAASSLAYIRSESGMCHAAAALGVRQVTLFGGCMDADVMGYYPRQTCVVDREAGSPCGAWLPCDHCRQAMDRITVDRVVDALQAALASPLVLTCQ